MPNLVNSVAEEIGDATFGCFVAGIVVKAGFVGGLGANTDNDRGLVGNVPVVEGGAGRPGELGGAVASFLHGNLRKWTPSNWSYGMTMRRGRRVSLIASRPFNGGEGVVSLFEEAGDHVSVHFGWLLQGFTHKLGEYVSWQEVQDVCCRGSR